MKLPILVLTLALLGTAAEAATEGGVSIGTRGGGDYQAAMLKAEALSAYRKARKTGVAEVEGVELEILISKLSAAKVVVAPQAIYRRLGRVPSLGDRASQTIYAYIDPLDGTWDRQQKVWEMTHGVLELLSIDDAKRFKSFKIAHALMRPTDPSARDVEYVFETNFPADGWRTCRLADKTSFVDSFNGPVAEMERNLRAAMDKANGNCIKLEMSDFPRDFFLSEESVRAFSRLYIYLILPREIVRELIPWMRLDEIDLKQRLLEKVARAGLMTVDRDLLYGIADIGLDKYESNLSLKPKVGVGHANLVAAAAAWVIAQSGTQDPVLLDKAYRVLKASGFQAELAEPVAQMRISDPEKLLEVASVLRQRLSAGRARFDWGWERYLRLLGASEPRDPRVVSELQALLEDLNSKFSAEAVANMRIDWIEDLKGPNANLSVLARCFIEGERQYLNSFVIAGDLADYNRTGRVNGIYAKEGLYGPYSVNPSDFETTGREGMSLTLTRQAHRRVRLTGTYKYLTYMLGTQAVDAFEGTSEGAVLEAGVRTSKQTVSRPDRMSPPQPNGVLRCQLSPDLAK